MKLTGSYKLNATKEVVWEALNNPNILKQCIPGCKTFDKESDTVFKAVATNQIGPMNATFSGTLTLSTIKENQRYTLSGEGQSTVGFASASADVNLSEESGSTVLSYEVNFNIGGKVAQLGSRLIGGVGKKMSDYFFGHFSDLVAPIKVKEKSTGAYIEEKRVVKLKSNFLNKYVYFGFAVLVLLLVVIFYFVSR